MLNYDPITLEVLRNALQSVAEEMGVTLIRTALSPNIKDRRDCSTAIYTTRGHLVAQAEHIPLHLGLMPTVLQAVLNICPVQEMAPGDAIIVNDPYLSGSHLPDVCIMAPVFSGPTPLAVVANLAHHVDMGGMVPGSMSTTATSIFQEGLRIPPVKISSRGRINQDLLAVLAHNVRTKNEFYGDIRAQLSANRLGSHRLQELVQRVGTTTLQEYMEEMINYTERRLRAAIRQIPPGSYNFTDYLEGDGINPDPIPIMATVNVREEQVQVDFTGTHPQVPGPVNATRGVTLACVYYTLKAVADPDLPASEGIARVVDVITPPGSLVNPNFPAPVAHANINTAQRITDVLLGALAQAVPHRVIAAGTGSMNNFTIGGWDHKRQRHYSYVETYGGGQGGKYNQDGMDGVHVNMTNTMNTPVEVMEMNYPLRVEEYALVPDSGGAGRFRGGTGLRRKITVLEEATVAISTERNTSSPWGLAGGKPGRTSHCRLELPDGTTAELPGKCTQTVPRGSTITLETAGGGGYGDPRERNRSALQQDIRDGLVSRDMAKTQYGPAWD